jgi:ERCC4-related helicase
MPKIKMTNHNQATIHGIRSYVFYFFRVMIFSKYRDSVQEITACLHAFKPLVKVMEFVGQAGAKGDLIMNTMSSNQLHKLPISDFQISEIQTEPVQKQVVNFI